MEKRKNKILIFVTGMSPQVVTETLYALLIQQNESVHEIYILTTAEGKTKLVELDLAGQIEQMCKIYKKPCPKFDHDTNIHVAREEDVEISDIRTSRDNMLFPDLIVNLIREKTESNNTQIHCSIAGGRKTMSVAMAYALSLFGRKSDRLSHVLVSKEFENSKKFFPANNTEGRQIILADVPFIRLRDKLPLLKEQPKASFTELVALTQKEIDEWIALPPVIVEQKMRRITTDTDSIVFPPFEFAVYLFFLKSKRYIIGGKKFSKNDSEKIMKYYKLFALSEGQIQRVRAANIHGGFIDFIAIQKAIAQIKRRIRIALNNNPTSDNYIISVSGGYGAKAYGITLDKKKIVWK